MLNSVRYYTRNWNAFQKKPILLFQTKQILMLKKMTLMAFIAILLTACSSEPSVIGHWKVASVVVQGEERADPSEEKSLEFFEDGTFFSGERGKHIDRDGTWEHDNDVKTLSMMANDGNRDDGAYTIITLTDEELVITKDELTVTLTKLETTLK